ncbi:MAG TPA: acyl-CoA dehydrogenase family protein, partial [Vicinamibacterales bacterium]|nr:acyl-CoA dehydrogenase family protein [Vicinamibacterales bacterium]
MTLSRLPFFEERHAALAADVEQVAAQVAPRAAAADAGDVNAAALEILAILARAGLLRLLAPTNPAADASALELRSLCLARERLAFASGLADSVFAVDGLGAYPIALAGSDDLKRRYLPGVVDGSRVGAFAITEANAGSDLRAMRLAARRDGGNYILDGAKTFISNAGIASHYVVFARTSEDERRGISAFVADASPSIAVNPIPLLAPHPIGELTFASCVIPASNRLGEEGDGLKIAHATLDFFRASVGAAACGLAARALAEARTRVSARKQFGGTIADFQATKMTLADMATELDAARLLVYRAAWLKDRGTPRITREASMAKLFATETAQRVVDRAVQLHGGLGVVRGVAVERLYREVRALRIYEGTSEIQRLIIGEQVLKGSDPIFSLSVNANPRDPDPGIYGK